MPVKYSNESENNNNLTNYMVGATFLGALVWIYRSKHGGGAAKTGTGAAKKGGFGGGGGMNDMMGMGKSNV